MDRRETNHKWYSSFDEEHMLFIIETDEEEGDKEIPATYTVCGTCDGKGKHVNPAIDSNGLSEEDFDRDPDFREDYFSGLYDVPCNECKGNRVSPEVDWKKLTPELKKYVEDWIQEHYSYQQECEMERRMGC
jgi:hypothetical protein